MTFYDLFLNRIQVYSIGHLCQLHIYCIVLSGPDSSSNLPTICTCFKVKVAQDPANLCSLYKVCTLLEKFWRISLLKTCENLVTLQYKKSNFMPVK